MIRLAINKRLNLAPPVLHEKRVFASVLPDGDGYSGLLREYTHAFPAGPTELWRVNFDANGNQTWHDPLGISAEDPRVFMWEGRMMALAWSYPQETRLDWKHYLIDVASGEKTRLRMDGFHGKNWVPVVGGPELLIIRSLFPLIILKPNLDTGECQTVFSDPGEIGQYRGGSVATIRDGVIRGFGHRTESGDTHSIFAYEIYTDCWLTRFMPVVMPDGFNQGINDPTSAWDGSLVCCCTERSWAVPGEVSHFVLDVQEQS